MIVKILNLFNKFLHLRIQILILYKIPLKVNNSNNHIISNQINTTFSLT
jgi:hypothetical protein